MLYKLHHKFVMINLACVLSVMAVVFTTLYIFTDRKNIEFSYQQLEKALQQPYLTSWNRKEGYPQVQVFQTDYNFQVISEESSSLNHAVMQDMANQIAKKDRRYGLLSIYEARYLYQVEWDGIHIAIMDRSREKQSMYDLFVNSLLLFLIASVLFVVISWHLGKWALKPVSLAWGRQKQFISDASHELKTPITIILANLNILSHHPKDEIQTQKKWIDNTQIEANRMKQLVEQLLFLSRSDEEVLQAEKTKLNLSDLLQQTTLIYEAIAFENNITLTSEIEKDLWIYGNEGMIQQLLTILMDNACKYCDSNKEITIHAKVDAKQAVIMIGNSSPELPKEELDHLFDRFYRSEKSRNRKQGGYGLGLSIAKTICEKHQGNIQVAYQHHRIIFTITLPLFQS